MKFKILILAALLMGCSASTSSVRAPATFESLKPVFQEGCLKSAGQDQSEFCSCTWNRTTQIYSADEISKGLKNGPKIKLDLWKVEVLLICAPQIK